jgi:hypothetical protein
MKTINKTRIIRPKFPRSTESKKKNKKKRGRNLEKT